MNKKQRFIFILLITFVFICLISVSVLANTSYQANIEMSNNYNQQQNQTQLNQQTVQNETSQVQVNQTTENINNVQNNINTNIQEQKIEGDEALPTKQKTELLKMKSKSRDSLEKYKQKYKNNVIYGTIAYVLNIARLASVPVFVVGYLVSIVYEFIVGMKRREMVRKGRGMRITLVSAFVMAQVLPLIFAIVIKFWGN